MNTVLISLEIIKSCYVWFWSQLTFYKRKKKAVRSLVTLFNGKSTFVGYLMPKPFSLEEQ